MRRVTIPNVKLNPRAAARLAVLLLDGYGIDLWSTANTKDPQRWSSMNLRQLYFVYKLSNNFRLISTFRFRFISSSVVLSCYCSCVGPQCVFGNCSYTRPCTLSFYGRYWRSIFDLQVNNNTICIAPIKSEDKDTEALEADKQSVQVHAFYAQLHRYYGFQPITLWL